MNLTSNIHLFVENGEGYLLPFLYLEYNLSINNINKDYEITNRNISDFSQSFYYGGIIMNKYKLYMIFGIVLLGLSITGSLAYYIWSSTTTSISGIYVYLKYILPEELRLMVN